MTAFDVKKTLDSYQARHGQFRILEVPRMQYLSVDGHGDLVESVRLEALDEGLSVQTLHVGSYDDEAETLAELHDEFIPSNGLVMSGTHHEIYFSDFRKVEASKLRTILRQPVARQL